MGVLLDSETDSTKAPEVVSSGEKSCPNKVYTDSKNALMNEQTSSFIVTQAVKHSMVASTSMDFCNL